MTRDEYEATIKKLGLNAEEAAALVGVKRRSSYRYLDGKRKVPRPVARFLEYLLITKRSGAYAMKKLETSKS